MHCLENVVVTGIIGMIRLAQPPHRITILVLRLAPSCHTTPVLRTIALDPPSVIRPVL